MNPTEYEHHVASILRSEGWATEVTPATADGGVDIIGSLGDRQLAVQVKMYGAGRKVNAQAVHELFGAGTSRGCTDFMIATDGQWLPAAAASAEALGVELRSFPLSNSAVEIHGADELQPVESTTDEPSDFGHVWEQISGLIGPELHMSRGGANTIVSVDGGGLTRISSTGRTSKIDIEIFKWTVDRLVRGDVVTRDEINQQYPKRASSGVVLILGSLPQFEVVDHGGAKALRLVSV